MDENKEPGLYDVISEKLQLDQMYGQNVASLFLIAHLLPALVEVGVFTKAQAEAVVTRASSGLDIALESDTDRDDPTTMRKYAHRAFDDFRKSVRNLREPE
jgi:hypothetical protein